MNGYPASGPAPDGVPALATFERHLARAGSAVLVFDYDGTLAPFAIDPADVRPWAGVPEALDAFMASGRVRVVVVTGRCIADSSPVLGMQHVPELWGTHGREHRLPDGSYEVVLPGAEAQRALALAAGWAPLIEAEGGRQERKPGALAFHWRGCTAEQAARLRVLITESFRREELGEALALREFDGGLELRAPGPDKGSVIRTVLAGTPAGTPVAFLGDDLTDEDAFRALAGRGLAVLVRPVTRATAADAWVSAPDGLLVLLQRWRAALGTVDA